MNRRRVRARLQRLLHSLSQALDDEGLTPGWYLTDRQKLWVSKEPRRFEDLDKLAVFTERLVGIGGVDDVVVDNTTHLARQVPGGDPTADGGAPMSQDLLDLLGRLPASELRYLEFSGRTTGVRNSLWTISMSTVGNFGSHGRRVTMRWNGNGSGEGEGTLNSLHSVVDDFTVKAGRSAVLVPPLRAPDAARQAHERSLQRRAGWVGLISGFGGGIVSGLLAAWATISAATPPPTP